MKFVLPRQKHFVSENAFFVTLFKESRFSADAYFGGKAAFWGGVTVFFPIECGENRNWVRWIGEESAVLFFLDGGEFGEKRLDFVKKSAEFHPPPAGVCRKTGKRGCFSSKMPLKCDRIGIDKKKWEFNY